MLTYYPLKLTYCPLRLTVVELCEGSEAVRDARVLVDETSEEEEVAHRLQRCGGAGTVQTGCGGAEMQMRVRRCGRCGCGAGLRGVAIERERAGHRLARGQLEYLSLDRDAVPGGAEPPPPLCHGVGVGAEAGHDSVDREAAERRAVQPRHVELLAVHLPAAAVDDRLHGGADGGVAGASSLEAEHLAEVCVARARRDKAECAARDSRVLTLHEACDTEAAVTVGGASPTMRPLRDGPPGRLWGSRAA